MFEGWTWRYERSREKMMEQSALFLSGQGQSITVEELLGRPRFPILRSISQEDILATIGVKSSTKENLLNEAKETKALFGED